jgi:hypothetical protein
LHSKPPRPKLTQSAAAPKGPFDRSSIAELPAQNAPPLPKPTQSGSSPKPEMADRREFEGVSQATHEATAMATNIA